MHRNNRVFYSYSPPYRAIVCACRLDPSATWHACKYWYWCFGFVHALNSWHLFAIFTYISVLILEPQLRLISSISRSVQIACEHVLQFLSIIIITIISNISKKHSRPKTNYKPNCKPYYNPNFILCVCHFNHLLLSLYGQCPMPLNLHVLQIYS